MRKIKHFLKKNLFWVLFLSLSLSFLSVYFVIAYEVGTNIQVCTNGVSQPACYSGAYPTPTLYWTNSGSSSQTRYQVQIDNNSNYASPTISSGTVVSATQNYTVGSSGLSFDSLYYWRVRVLDNFGSWTGYAQGADTLFITAGSCNSIPTASSLSVVTGNYCSSPSHYFSWIYSDADSDTQSRFMLQVDNSSDFSSPTVNRDYAGLSNPSPTTNNQTVLVTTSPETPGSDQLAYNTTYYWRVSVWDSQAASSGWVNGSSFTTSQHRWPTIDFNWAPVNPSKDEDVQFTDQSTVYGGSSKSSWSWTFPDGTPANSSLQNPINIKFNSSGAKAVTLQVTDSNGHSCPGTKNVDINIELPDWEEITPW